jgi:hypothetical protein
MLRLFESALFQAVITLLVLSGVLWAIFDEPTGTMKLRAMLGIDAAARGFMESLLELSLILTIAFVIVVVIRRFALPYLFKSSE